MTIFFTFINYKFNSLNHLLRTISLKFCFAEAVTRLSPECCEQMVEGHALPVIFKLIRSCNRSIPHMELIKYSVTVLLNVAKVKPSVHVLWL